MSRIKNIFLCGVSFIAASQIAVIFIPWLASSQIAAAVCSFAGLLGLAVLTVYFKCAFEEISTLASDINSQTRKLNDKSRYRIISNLAESVDKSLSDCNHDIISLTQQLSDLNLQLQLLQRHNRNTEEIIYSIRDAVIVTDAAEKVLLANQAAGLLFGFDSQLCKLKNISQLTHNQDFVQLIRQSRQSKTRHVKHEFILLQNDAQKTYECIISCICDNQDNVVGLITMLHDITREKEISQMKNDFVSHVSHELKTPLASITAYAEMLVDGEAQDDVTRSEFYSIIQAQAQRLNRLIEDILNISRIESGLIKINKEPMSMTILIRDAVQMIKSYADQKNITVHQQTPIIYDQVLADKDMISQVIINLLSNAVKYTPSGGSINVTSEVNEADGIIRITVTDNGVGIPANDLPHVFDKFFRAAANNKCAKGTGLGLNLVKQIVEKVHDGRVFVTSEQGKGSTFGFELPLGVGRAVSAT